jgi:hypothetical protein
MIWLDKKYLNLISHKLERFAWKSDRLANMRCPLCGDSQKNKLKARGYAFELKGSLMYKCHNCSASMAMPAFIKMIDENTYREYMMEKFGAANNVITTPPRMTMKAPVFRAKIDLPTIESLEDDHYARQYIANRRIPKEFWTNLYYAEDFRGFIDQLVPEHGKGLKSDARIVIPFYDTRKKLVAVQGRALAADNKIRYITIKIDEEAPKIYGLDRVDVSKTTYVVEGPIDSMFLPNAIAIAGANLIQVRQYVNDDTAVFISDNEPRNKDVVRQIEHNINAGLRVCIWPSAMNCKDINDLILSGKNSQQIVKMIDGNVFSGVKAKFMLNQWKKI